MRRITTRDIIAALRTQVPLSVSQKEVVGGLRTWLTEGRALSASEITVATQSPPGIVHLEPVLSPGEQ
jgi:hypothetical protein